MFSLLSSKSVDPHAARIAALKDTLAKSVDKIETSKSMHEKVRRESLYTSLFLSLLLSVSLCLCVSLCLSPSHYLSLCLCLSVSLSLYLSLCLSRALFLSLLHTRRETVVIPVVSLQGPTGMPRRTGSCRRFLGSASGGL